MTTRLTPHMTLLPIPRRRALGVAFLAAASVPAIAVRAQDRLESMPGYDQYKAMNGRIQGAVKSGALMVRWLEDGKALEYRKDGKTWRCDVATGQALAHDS